MKRAIYRKFQNGGEELEMVSKFSTRIFRLENLDYLFGNFLVSSKQPLLHPNNGSIGERALVCGLVMFELLHWFERILVLVILESDWFLARLMFPQLLSNNSQGAQLTRNPITKFASQSRAIFCFILVT